MILLDTNVLSELMRPAPEPRVVRWLDSCFGEDIWVCAATQAQGRSRRSGGTDVRGGFFRAVPAV